MSLAARRKPQNSRCLESPQKETAGSMDCDFRRRHEMAPEVVRVVMASCSRPGSLGLQLAEGLPEGSM